MNRMDSFTDEVVIDGLVDLKKPHMSPGDNFSVDLYSVILIRFYNGVNTSATLVASH